MNATKIALDLNFSITYGIECSSFLLLSFFRFYAFVFDFISFELNGILKKMKRYDKNTFR